MPGAPGPSLAVSYIEHSKGKMQLNCIRGRVHIHIATLSVKLTLTLEPTDPPSLTSSVAVILARMLQNLHKIVIMPRVNVRQIRIKPTNPLLTSI